MIWRGINNYIGVILCCVFSPFLWCMDGEIKKDHIIVWETMLTHGVSFFDHDAVCRLALVCKDFKKIVKDATLLRKQYFAQRRGFSLNGQDITFHEYGAVYMQCCHKTESFIGGPNSENLHINLAYLGDHCVFSTQWEVKKFEFFSYIHPFFNQKGRACLYGYNSNSNKNIFEYSYNKSGTKKELRCVVGLKDQGRTVSRNLADIAQLPLLVAAILHSTSTHELLTGWRQANPVKIHYLEGVTIPEGCIEDPQFKMLPEIIQKAVVTRYSTQKRVS